MIKKSGLIIFFLVFVTGFSQSQCVVLVEALKGTYEGECKKGVAHGKGIAKGTDRYEGMFNKGIMHGEGTYIWSNGDKYTGEWNKGLQNGFGEFVPATDNSKSQRGIWRKDVFLRAQQNAVLYEVGNLTNIKSINLRKSGEGDRVYIKFKSSYGTVNKINDLSLNGSSGSEILELSNCGFEKVLYPLKANVNFRASNAMNSVVVDYRFVLTIFEPGIWEVIVNF